MNETKTYGVTNKRNWHAQSKRPSGTYKKFAQNFLLVQFMKPNSGLDGLSNGSQFG